MKNFLTSKVSFSIFFSLIFIAVFFWQTFVKGLIPAPTDALVGLYHPFRDFYSGSYPRGMPFKNFLITDPVRQQIPWRKIVVDELKAGVLPWWNPFSFSGVPLAANIQSGAYYPFNVLFLLLPFEAGWTVLIFIQPFLAVIFMFLFLRKKGISKSASLVGAVCFGYSGFSIAWLTWGTIGHVVLWTPLILYIIDELISIPFTITNHKFLGLSFLFILLLFFQVSAGHIQAAVYCMILELSYAVYVAGALKLHRKEKYTRFIAVVSVFTVFVTVSSVVWFPMLQEILSSARAGDPNAWNVPGWFLPFQNLIQFVIPDFFGNPATMNYFGIWNYGEFIGYIGIFPLIVVFLSIYTLRKTWFWWSCLLVFLFLVTPTIFGKIPYLAHIPLLSSIQPSRMLVIIDISLSILAAYGVDLLLSRVSKRGIFLLSIVPGIVFSISGVTYAIKFFTKDEVFSSNLSIALRNSVFPVLLTVVSFVFIVFWLYIKEKGYRFRRVFVVLMLAIILTDLFRFGWKFTPFVSGKYFFPNTSLISFLQSVPKPFRVAVLDDKIFPPNVLSYYGIESVDGYDPVYGQRYTEYLHVLDTTEVGAFPAFQRIVSVRNMSSVLLKLLNVKFYITFNEISLPNFKKVFSEGNTLVYEDTTFMPRAYFASSVRYSSSDFDTLKTMLNVIPGDTFVSILEEKDKKILPDTYDLTKNSLRFMEYSGYSMKIKTQTKGDQLLVLSQKFDSSLRVTVDTKRVIPLRVNYMFTGVRIPRGEHIISLKYSPI
ncbi:YfhO family protein [Candidatus Gottesmanbacteria bacterium]|nr:YfhO family protein [Candidatus Gottesmanbacteria bacterium]